MVGAAAIIDRGAATDVGVPFHALARIAVPAWDPAACPLCAEGQPVEPRRDARLDKCLLR